VDSAATDRLGRGGTGLEEADCEQPAVNPHGARPRIFRGTQGGRSLVRQRCRAGREWLFWELEYPPSTASVAPRMKSASPM
jgi:hypothetical protein